MQQCKPDPVGLSQTLQAELRSIYKDALAAVDASDDDLSEKQNAHWASSVMYSFILPDSWNKIWRFLRL